MSPTRDRLHVTLLVGTDPDELAVATSGLALTLRDPLVVRFDLDHDLDLGDGSGAIAWTVSDATGLLEQGATPLDHACETCALRAEIVPTLVRLAAAHPGRDALVRLPLATDPAPVVRGVLDLPVGGRRAARDVDVRTVVCATAAPDLEHDLLGDDLLRERDPQAWPGDSRAVGEALARQLEYADLLLLTGGTWGAGAHARSGVPRATAAGSALLDALRRPDSLRVDDPTHLDPDLLADHTRDHRRAAAWTGATTRAAVLHGVEVAGDDPAVRLDHGAGVWTLALDTWRPLHPGRLMKHLPRLGTGPVRGRGCFWLPTRPGVIAQWEGGGGQLSLGTPGSFGPVPARTRVVLTGTSPDPDDVAEALATVLMTDLELASGLGRWVAAEDPFDPWLGARAESA